MIDVTVESGHVSAVIHFKGLSPTSPGLKLLATFLQHTLWLAHIVGCHAVIGNVLTDLLAGLIASTSIMLACADENMAKGEATSEAIQAAARRVNTDSILAYVREKQKSNLN